MNTTGKPYLFLLTFALLFGGIGLQSALSHPQPAQLNEPQAQETEPIEITVEVTLPPGNGGGNDDGGGGSGGMSTIWIAVIVIALVAVVGLALAASRGGGRAGP